MYSDQLDDEDLEFVRRSFFRYAEGSSYYRLMEKDITRLTRESGVGAEHTGKRRMVTQRPPLSGGR